MFFNENLCFEMANDKQQSETITNAFISENIVEIKQKDKYGYILILWVRFATQ